MKNSVVVSNLDVGSAIESSGNQIVSWINQVVDNVEEFKLQTHESHFYSFLQEHNPKVVVVNSLYPRITTPLYYYRLCNPEVKIILVPRTYPEIITDTKIDNIYKFYYNSRLESLLKLVDYIFIINSCNQSNRIPNWLSHKCIDCCGTNSRNQFHIKKPWDQREKKFIILGSLNPHKVSPEFIDRIQSTNVQIDVYGNTKNQPEWFAEKFNSCSNIEYKGELPQEEVNNVLNEYKYYLLPHNGQEPLCNSLHQAILCGCIPIVFDDYAKDYNGDYWLEFMKEMYFGCDKMEDYINAIEEINSSDFQNGIEISEYNRQQYLDKYEGKFEREIKSKIKELLYE